MWYSLLDTSELEKETLEFSAQRSLEHHWNIEMTERRVRYGGTLKISAFREQGQKDCPQV